MWRLIKSENTICGHSRRSRWCSFPFWNRRGWSRQAYTESPQEANTGMEFFFQVPCPLMLLFWREICDSELQNRLYLKYKAKMFLRLNRKRHPYHSERRLPSYYLKRGKEFVILFFFIFMVSMWEPWQQLILVSLILK